MTTTILRQKFLGSTGKNGRGHGLNDQLFGHKIGLITRLFGCWHDNLSRPYIKGKAGYRTCLNCGARTQFDPVTYQTSGRFYCPPAINL